MLTLVWVGGFNWVTRDERKGVMKQFVGDGNNYVFTSKYVIIVMEVSVVNELLN